MKAHPIRKHVTLTMTLTLAEAEALALVLSANAGSVRGIRGALNRALASLRWIPQLEQRQARAGLA